MKKVLIAIAYMNSAGTEMAMLNLIKSLEGRDLDITVFLISSRLGVWQDRIPKHCKIIESPLCDEDQYNAVFGLGPAIKKNIRKLKLFKAAEMYFRRKLGGDAISQISAKWQNIPPLEEEYDLAICYMGHNPFLVKYIATKVSAKRKVLFAHNNINDGKSRLALCEGLENYDMFYGVSEQIVAELKKMVGEGKADIMHNYVPVEQIIEKSNEQEDAFGGFEGIKLLTIGRLSSAKGIDIVIEAMLELKKSYGDVRWFVIGDGPDKRKYENRIKKLGLKKDFIFLGVKDNPYTFIRQCDIYIQPSRHEGYCTTVNEARVINKPIIATDVSGTREMLIDGVNGLIVDFDKMQIVEAVKKLIDDSSFREHLTQNLKDIDYANTSELENFVKLNGI